MIAAVTSVKRSTKQPPTLELERQLWGAGAEYVVGVDEVGRGAWAGPLVVGVAVVPKDRRVYGVRDSKQLTERSREEMYDKVVGWCVDFAIGSVSNTECDVLGMSESQRLAARRAVSALSVRPDSFLVDGNWDFVRADSVTTVVKGDQRSLSIATASIIAKVSRDRLMREASAALTPYDFGSNKGYPSPRHRRTLRRIGPSRLHRLSWSFNKSEVSSAIAA